MAAPSFRALSRLFCSSAPKVSPPPCRRYLPADTLRLEGFLDIAKPGATMVFLASAESSSTASIRSKVEDEKLTEWYAWFGPRWWMAFELAEIRKKYPKIPVEAGHVAMLMEEGQCAKLLHAMSINLNSLV